MDIWSALVWLVKVTLCSTHLSLSISSYLSFGSNLPVSFCVAFSTPLHQAILSQNKPMFLTLLEQKGLQLEIQNTEGFTVLWLALQALAPDGTYDDDSFASRLLKSGSSPNAIKGDTGRRDTLWHLNYSVLLRWWWMWTLGRNVHIVVFSLQVILCFTWLPGLGVRKLLSSWLNMEAMAALLTRR